MTEPLRGQELVEYVDRHLDASLDRLEKSWEPVWRSQMEMGKAVLAMSSGTLVLSISLVQLLLARASAMRSTWLLPMAWGLLAASVIAAILRFGWMSRAQAFRIMLEYSRSTIRQDLRSLAADSDLGASVDAILASAIEKPWATSKKGIQVHDALTHAAFWSFAVALVCLTVFAIRNLSF